MRHNLIIHPDADADLDAIVAYIAADAPLNAGRVADRLAERIRSLREYPKSGRVAREFVGFDPELRQLSVFPHRVIYAIEGRTVHILRIVDGRRDELSSDDIPRISG